MSVILAAAAVAAAFDLHCAGQRTESAGPLLGGKSEPAVPTHRIFRVDMGAGRWCQGECTTTSAIVEITPTTVTFIKSDRSAGAFLLDEELVVHRESGAYIYRRRFGDPTRDVRVSLDQGNCRRMPFSGFPEKLF